jgi:hypothetical protein
MRVEMWTPIRIRWRRRRPRVESTLFADIDATFDAGQGSGFVAFDIVQKDFNLLVGSKSRAGGPPPCPPPSIAIWGLELLAESKATTVTKR